MNRLKVVLILAILAIVGASIALFLGYSGYVVFRITVTLLAMATLIIYYLYWLLGMLMVTNMEFFSKLQKERRAIAVDEPTLTEPKITKKLVDYMGSKSPIVNFFIKVYVQIDLKSFSYYKDAQEGKDTYYNYNDTISDYLVKTAVPNLAIIAVVVIYSL